MCGELNLSPFFHVDESGYWGGTGDGLNKIGLDGHTVFNRAVRTGNAEGVFTRAKWLGDKILLGGSASGAPGNDLSQLFGQQDAWVVWMKPNGDRIRDGVYGGVGREALGGWVQTGDGGFLLAIDSSGSGVSGNKTIDGDGLWLVKVSSTGAIQGQRLIADQLFLALGSTDTGISLLVRDSATGKRVQSIQIATEVVAKVRAQSADPFDLLTSTDLRNWRVLGERALGEVQVSQPARETAQFYRVVPAQ